MNKRAVNGHITYCPYDVDGPVTHSGISPAGVRKLLMVEIEAAGGVMPWCRLRGIYHPQVYQFLTGNRFPSVDILLAMGLRKQIIYEKREPVKVEK